MVNTCTHAQGQAEAIKRVKIVIVIALGKGP